MRWHNDGRPPSLYIGLAMEACESPAIEAGATVENTLRLVPQAATVFLDHQMACVGCVMSCFDTLADAALIYGMPVETLLTEIRALANPEPPPPTEEAMP